MSGSILVITFDTSTGIRTGRLVGSALIEDNAITSGKLGSGQIGVIHFAPFSSGMVVLGQDAGVTPVYGYPPAGVTGDESITSAKLASGAVIGDRIAFGGIWSGKIASGAVIGNVIANLAIVSTHIGVGVVGDDLLKNAGVLSGKLAASVVGGDKVWSYGIISGKIASGGVTNDVIAHRGILSGKLTSGATLGDVVANRGVWSGKIASGAIAGDAIASWGILSGSIASGIITEQQLVSGISIDIAETSEEPGYRAKEAISSYACVYIADMSGNYVGLALALSGSMPAIGIAGANIASNALGIIHYGGRAAAHTAVVSGQYGKPVYVGTDGQLKITPPSVSGNIQQVMGTVKNDDEVFLFPEPQGIEIA